MEPYLFTGVVLPQRAQLTIQFGLAFEHIGTDRKGVANVSIINNQIAVWVATDHEWDIFDLRNVVRNIVRNDLAIIGFLKGYAYDIELTRVTNQSKRVDYVFGIDIPCITDRGKSIDVNAALRELRDKTIGPNGVFLHRCFRDLVSAMKDAGSSVTDAPLRRNRLACVAITATSCDLNWIAERDRRQSVRQGTVEKRLR